MEPDELPTAGELPRPSPPEPAGCGEEAGFLSPYPTETRRLPVKSIVVGRPGLKLPAGPRSAGAGKCLVFRLGVQRFAAPVKHVLEVQRPLRDSALPNMPDWLWGAALVRGQVIAVLDLSGMLHASRDGESSQRSIVVVQSPREAFVAGLMVDELLGEFELQITPGLTPRAPGPVARGVALAEGRETIVLHIDRLLAQAKQLRFSIASGPGVA